MSRSTLPRVAACLACAITSVLSSLAVPEIGPASLVEIRQGLVRGVAARDPAITVYKGIPFAAAPVGALRWTPPQSAPAWEGVRDASEFCASCVQEIRRSYLPWTEEYMFRNDVSEDCLALNIWTPARRADERLPVYVYIHGGAYYGGSGEVLLYDGEGLARKGVIVVTLNYRLGVFGFLAHPELTAESPHGSSGNYGLLDQIAGLRWVRENIAAFGGDPDRVTVGGQSAGAGSVHHLLVSPLARGLFQRAIAQSGPWRRGADSPTLAAAEKQGAEFATAIEAPDLAALRALPAETLFARYFDRSFFFRPIVDGWVVPEQVVSAHENGHQIDVPLLTGWTADERSSRAGYGRTTRQEFIEQAKREFGPGADAFLKLYPVPNDAEAGPMQVRAWRDADRAGLAWWTGLRAARGRSPDWTYVFARGIPWPEHPEYGAFHSGELPYTFNNLGLMNRPWEDADHRLAELVSEYWANFIKHGDPNAPGLPAWPDDNGTLMHFDTTPAAEAVLSPDKQALYLGTSP